MEPLCVLICGALAAFTLVPVVIFGHNNFLLYFGGIYSALAWTLLGYTVYNIGEKERKSASFALQ